MTKPPKKPKPPKPLTVELALKGLATMGRKEVAEMAKIQERLAVLRQSRGGRGSGF